MNSKIFNDFRELLSPGYVFHKILSKDLEEVPRLAKGTLLDVSCGNKPYEGIFQNKVDYYVGIDLPATAYGISEVDVFSSTLELPFNDGGFDTDLAIQLLRHSLEPQKFFPETHCVLKNGGVLILSVRLMNPVHEVPHDFPKIYFVWIGLLGRDDWI